MNAKRGASGLTSSGRNRSRLSRLVTTSSLTVALLLLFLPFLGVSCESRMGTLKAEISGWDMAVGGASSVSRTGVFSRPELEVLPTPAGHVVDNHGDVRVQPLMVLAVLAIGTGLLAAVILPTARSRALGAGITAAAAALLLTINQIDVTNDLVDQITTGTGGMAGMAGDPGDMVENRIGFWLTLGALVLTAAFHLGYLTLRRRGRTPPRGQNAYPPPGPAPPAGP